MKTFAFAAFAAIAATMAIADHTQPIGYNDWVERNSNVSAGQRPNICPSVAAFVTWSKNYPAK